MYSCLLNCFVLLPMTPPWTIKCIFLLLLGLSKFLFRGNHLSSDKKKKHWNNKDYDTMLPNFRFPHTCSKFICIRRLKFCFVERFVISFAEKLRTEICLKKQSKSLNFLLRWIFCVVSFFFCQPSWMQNVKQTSSHKNINDKQRMSFWREYFNIYNILGERKKKLPPPRTIENKIYCDVVSVLLLVNLHGFMLSNVLWTSL